MIDWVKNDPSVPPCAKGDVQTLYSDTWLKVCRDLANASKHFELKPNSRNRPPVTADASSSSGFGVGRFGKGEFGIGEESIEIELNTGTTFQCAELVNGVIASWQTFFAAHGI